MQILNRYYLKTGFDTIWWMPVIGLAIALIGATVAFGGNPDSGFVFLFVAVVIAFIYLVFGTTLSFETDIEVLECVFESEEDIEDALRTYEIIEVRGYIHRLVAKEEVVE